MSPELHTNKDFFDQFPNTELTMVGNNETADRYMIETAKKISFNFVQREGEVPSRFEETDSQWSQLGLVMNCVDERSETQYYQGSYGVPGGGAEWDERDLFNRIISLKLTASNFQLPFDKVTLLGHEGCGWGALQTQNKDLKGGTLSSHLTNDLKQKAETLNAWLEQAGVDVSVQFGFDNFQGTDILHKPITDNEGNILYNKDNQMAWSPSELNFDEYNLNSADGFHYANELVINATSGLGKFVGAHGLKGPGPKNATFGYNYIGSTRDVSSTHPSVIQLIANIIQGDHSLDKVKKYPKNVFIMVDEYTINRVQHLLNNTTVDINKTDGTTVSGLLPDIVNEVGMNIMLFNPRKVV